MHITARIWEMKTKSEKFVVYVKEKIRRIWRLVIFASDTSAGAWELGGIKGKEKVYHRQMMHLDGIVFLSEVLLENLCRSIYYEVGNMRLGIQ